MRGKGKAEGHSTTLTASSYLPTLTFHPAKTMKTKLTFEKAMSRARLVRSRADVLQKSIHDRGWELAESVGIGRDMCCLHNASIDDEMKGWCKDNPNRLRVAKRAKHILSDWSISHKADRIISRILSSIA